MPENINIPMCQDKIRDYFISTIKLYEGQEAYETIAVYKDKWSSPAAQETTGTLRKARAAHRRACKNILHGFRHTWPRPEIENVFTSPQFWEK